LILIYSFYRKNELAKHDGHGTLRRVTYLASFGQAM
jgi:hypothetical protein